MPLTPWSRAVGLSGRGSSLLHEAQQPGRMLVVTAKTDDVARILKRLQSLVRRPRSGDRIVHSGRAPEDIATEDFRWLYLEPD